MKCFHAEVDGVCYCMQEVTDDKDLLSADITDDVEQKVSSDPVTGKHASKPNDIVIFVNLVDFCRWAGWCVYFGLW